MWGNAATVARSAGGSCEAGLEAAINDRPRPRSASWTASPEAHLAFACSAAACWAHGHSSCLVRHVVEWSDAEARPGDGDARYSKKRPWKKKEWCIPKVRGSSWRPFAMAGRAGPSTNRQYNPERPECVSSRASRQLARRCVRLPAPGRVARYDTEYQRNGTRNLFMICEPKGGWRHAEVIRAPHCCGLRCIDAVAGGASAYPDAEVVRLVLDNLLGSHEAFEQGEARRIAQRSSFITLLRRPAG